MSLILASSNEISVGKPPPWPLYDKEHNVLLCLGDIVEFHELQPNDCVAHAKHGLSADDREPAQAGVGVFECGGQQAKLLLLIVPTCRMETINFTFEA